MATHSSTLAWRIPWTGGASWAIVSQAPRSVGFSRQEYWSGLPFPSPGNLPDPGIKATSLAWQVDSLPLSPPVKPLHPLNNFLNFA